MELGFISLVAVLIIVVVLVLARCLPANRAKNNDVQGVIYAYYDESNTNPSLLLEYSVPIDDIASRKRVTFDVRIVR